MSTRDVFTKSRQAWHVRALRLLREEACVEYARRVVPPVVDGVHIQFPDTDVSLAPRISVRSRRIQGQPLMPMLYQPDMQDTALDLGMIALQALHSADVTSARFFVASWLYDLFRGPALALDEMLLARLLSRAQRLKLNRLAARSALQTRPRDALVHGDLHAAHLIVDLDRHALGFIDLEAMRIGKASTNFAHLWNAFYFADPSLGRSFYQRFAEQFDDLIDEQFDNDVRIELALRSYRHLQAAKRLSNELLQPKAYRLLHSILEGASFHDICFGEGPHGT